ncbi:hypothetical protein [Pseudaestuariivita rosea]|uniref:hypothetical protein n=1 Tax=Pseudaestuariivita rosea TaxID=2763263 RepID=UPI001ABAAD21|nr:hypothetical protein [Pseudaestuariivita rosea]
MNNKTCRCGPIKATSFAIVTIVFMCSQAAVAETSLNEALEDVDTFLSTQIYEGRPSKFSIGILQDAVSELTELARSNHLYFNKEYEDFYLFVSTGKGDENPDIYPVWMGFVGIENDLCKLTTLSQDRLTFIQTSRSYCLIGNLISVDANFDPQTDIVAAHDWVIGMSLSSIYASERLYINDGSNVSERPILEHRRFFEKAITKNLGF